MILDVGCGNTEHTLRETNVIHADIDRGAFDLEVLCDIQHLPFRDCCFNVVHASHVLEHIDDPLDAIKELARVSSRVCVVSVPNARMLKVGDDPKHIYSWNRITLHNLLSRHFKDVKVYGEYRGGHSKLRTLAFLVLSAVSDSWGLVAVCRNF